MKDKVAHFRFYEELNDYLPVEKRKISFEFRFKGNPGIKDPVESIGVPHTEVELIMVNGESVGFDYKLQNNDRVAVYPVFESFDVESIVKLRDEPLRQIRFVADVNLGRLARNLRLLGFDCLYQNDYTDADVVEIGVQQKRIILTRDRRLLFCRRITHGHLVLSDDPAIQTQKVIRRFQLENRIDPFHRCLDCNGCILRINKELIVEQLFAKTQRYYDEFYQCEACRKVYWKGPHLKNMLAKLKSVFL